MFTCQLFYWVRLAIYNVHVCINVYAYRNKNVFVFFLFHEHGDHYMEREKIFTTLL